MSRNRKNYLRSSLLLVCLVSSLELARLVIAQEKAATAVRPPVDYSPIIDKLKKQLPQQMAESNVPGLSIALVDGATLVWAEGFGTTERNGQTKVTADTLFSLQSISKTYTAAGFLIAVEKGLMKLDDPVKKYLPQFTVNSRFGADEADKITFRHLLSHWSGLTHEAPCGSNFDDRDCPFADHIRSVSETWLKFPVGERYSYSNLGIDLAGYCLEQRTRKPFDEFMNDELFRTLGMSSSTFNHKVAANNMSLAKGHTRDRILPVTPIPMIPAGSMYSTVKDMAKFISFQLAGGKAGGKQIIREELLKEMYAPQFPVEGQVGGYGLGIASEPLRRGTLLQHGGGGYGYLTSQIWTPEYQVGVIVLTNSSSSNPFQIASSVLQQMIDAKYGPVPRRGPAKFTDKPVIKLEAKLLQRLEGTYRRGNVVSFKVKKDALYLVSGTTDVELKAHSSTEFISGDQKYTFFLDEAGKPKGVQVLGFSGVEFMPFNDRPGEEAGPNKKEWQDLVGEYAGRIYGDKTKASVMIKNGYLYLEGWGGLKLTEYKPGLFFTADGEAVIFQNDRMFLGNRPYLKESKTPSLFSPQSTVIQSADKYADKLRSFEEFVRTQMEKDNIPGLTIGFYKDDYTWVKGFGYADLENKVPAKPESAYRLASVTKPFTSAAILQLAEKGKINLDAEIQTYVPSYPKQQWPVTVRQLLAHTGGGQEGSGLGQDYFTPQQVVERIARYPIKIEPGTKYIYTTSGYNLLGAAIENVSGKSFNDYMRENIFLPLGMIGTRMNSERELIPNRVRTYERVNGQIRVALFVDVSSRFGGGGLIGTMPDLLKWARGVDSGKILSKDSLDLMYTPVAMKNGYFAALDPFQPYSSQSVYSLGWHNLALNGQWVPAHGGSQIGTSTEFFRFPSKNMAIVFAANTQGVNGPLFIQRLYELLTDEPWEIPVYAKDRASQAFYDGLNSAFDYGAAWFDRRQKPYTDDPQELAKAFKYFNQAFNLGSLQSNDQAARKAISDGLHPVADATFFKVGSFIAAKLREKRGSERERVYHTMGALPFFADYIKLYQSQPDFPKDLRFNEAFEKLITKWNEDWTRTWNDYTQHLAITTISDIDALGQKLKQLFDGAEVYPNFVWALRNASFQSGNGVKAAKLNLDLYPQHWRSNASWGVYLLLLQRSQGALEGYRRMFGELGQPLDYFKKSFELNPDGLTSAYLNEIAKGYSDSKRFDDAIALLKVAVELHPKSPILYGSLGDLYDQKGQKDLAIQAYQKALEADPTFERAKEMLKKLAP